MAPLLLARQQTDAARRKCTALLKKAMEDLEVRLRVLPSFFCLLPSFFGLRLYLLPLCPSTPSPFPGGSLSRRRYRPGLPTAADQADAKKAESGLKVAGNSLVDRGKRK